MLGESLWSGQGSDGYGDGGIAITCAEGWFSKALTERYRGIFSSVRLVLRNRSTFIVTVLPLVMLALVKVSFELGVCDKLTDKVGVFSSLLVLGMIKPITTVMRVMTIIMAETEPILIALLNFSHPCSASTIA